MRILLYGGSFNPPHLGHEDALRAAREALHPDKTLVIPAGIPPHKALAEDSPSAEDRLRMTELAFADAPGAQVTDLELRRQGKSYTVDTLRQFRSLWPGAELCFLVGTDMLLYMEQWMSFREIFSLCTLAAMPREEGELPQLESFADYLRRTYGAGIIVIPKTPLPMSSTQLRAALPERRGRECLSPEVYAYIIRRRLYGARPELSWLREQADPYMKPKRIPHVRGVEQECLRLARIWGVDEGEAAEAGILHDLTKKCGEEEQLRMCARYGIMLDDLERAEPKLLHARTGAHLARELFGCSDAVCDAIEWHTTGRPGMSTLEMIVYLADISEVNRSFPGVEDIRAMTGKNLYQAMVIALEGSLRSIRVQGGVVHPRSEETLRWAKEQIRESKNEQSYPRG
ncbi:MAG: nicotinate (nicotinamide) nucleotide adenylyltransferase [Oscillospiraceae bacterium]|nr:nicotinate (nicotinamide) nucleotide adenylyltransferase [Oscillospiraceae bacterium]